ncbi:E3 ubiquitin-protein ligase TRIM7-like [Hemicordylus capensis]|uniref:E3 ubiquitin-protein ligase TRIM7-like n=1 Tax=Hemicordylus capensis TaxID=884348 RepID=UPI002304ADE5|nr:E3 ubiquitin-protein ligase TRIM7-like [Hemicordylus capensis]
MAAAAAALSVGKQLQDEATCSVCLDFFTDPVTLDCGHNFCQACIAQCWGEPPTVTACPQCRESFQPRNVKPNRQLANMVALLKEFSVQVKQQVGGWRVCGRHQEPLKLFCQDDEAPLCVVCHLSKEHRAHTVVPIQEAAQEYKDQFWSFLELLRKGREKILACKSDAEKESQNLLNQIVAERQKTVAEFRQLYQFLKEKETLMLTQIEEVEKETARRRDEYMGKLSKELSSLDKVIQEMEEKCEQSASELLQDVRSTLKRCKEKERFENPVAFPPTLKCRIWVLCDNSTFLESFMKKFKDNLVSGFQLQEAHKPYKKGTRSWQLDQIQANVTLDPDTVHPGLILTEDRKTVRWGEKLQDLPNNPERFDNGHFVLGCEGFTAGRHCWEVSVKSGMLWAVGVASKSVKRKGTFYWGPKEGIWALGKWGRQYQALDSHAEVPLHLNGEPKRIRVTLDCVERQVAFSDVDSAAPIYTCSEASFSGEPLLPFFWVGCNATLTLSP